MRSVICRKGQVATVERRFVVKRKGKIVPCDQQIVDEKSSVLSKKRERVLCQTLANDTNVEQEPAPKQFKKSKVCLLTLSNSIANVFRPKMIICERKEE